MVVMDGLFVIIVVNDVGFGKANERVVCCCGEKLVVKHDDGLLLLSKAAK